MISSEVKDAVKDALSFYTDKDPQGQPYLRVSIDAPVAVSNNIAQWGGVNTSLGQKAMVASVPVVIALDQGALPVTLPVGTETVAASLVVDSTASPVAAGKLSVTFTTNLNFVGTILGVARNASTAYSFSINNPGKTLSAIAYTVTAGSMTIDTQI